MFRISKIIRDKLQGTPWTLSSFDEWNELCTEKKELAIDGANQFVGKETYKLMFRKLRICVDMVSVLKEMVDNNK